MYNGYDGVDTGYVIQCTLVNSDGKPTRWVDYNHKYYKTRENAEKAVMNAFERIPNAIGLTKFRILFRRDEVIAEVGKKED